MLLQIQASEKVQAWGYWEYCKGRSVVDGSGRLTTCVVRTLGFVG